MGRMGEAGWIRGCGEDEGGSKRERERDMGRQ